MLKRRPTDGWATANKMPTGPTKYNQGLPKAHYIKSWKRHRNGTKMSPVEVGGRNYLRWEGSSCPQYHLVLVQYQKMFLQYEDVQYLDARVTREWPWRETWGDTLHKYLMVEGHKSEDLTLDGAVGQMLVQIQQLKCRDSSHKYLFSLEKASCLAPSEVCLSRTLTDHVKNGRHSFYIKGITNSDIHLSFRTCS